MVPPLVKTRTIGLPIAAGRSHSPRVAVGLAVVCLVGGLATPQRAAAQRYETAVTRIAEDVAEFLEKKGQRDVKVQDFAAGDATSVGRRVRLDLSQELWETHGLNVPVDKKESLRLRSALLVTGDISHDVVDGLPIVLFKTQVRGRGNTELTEFRHRMVTEAGTIAEMLGLNIDQSEQFEAAREATVAAASTAAVAAIGEAAAQQQKAAVKKETVSRIRREVAEQLDQPQFHRVSQSIMAADADSEFQLEVLVKKNGRLTPLALEDFTGQPFAPLASGNVYAVRLINNSDHDVSVELMIDGLNTLRFSRDEQFRKQGRWIVAASSSGTVEGWHDSGRAVHEFLITPVPDSRIAELQAPTGDIGIITASFYYALAPGEEKPEFESLITSASLGTGKGARIESERIGTVERQHGQQRLATLSLRYVNPKPPGLPAGL